MESDTALQAYVIYRNPWQTEELLGEQTSRKTNLQQIVCGLELCAYITLSLKFTKYANYENVPSTTIHFLEANYTTPLGISTVLKNHFISVLPDSHRGKYANLPFSLYAHSLRLD